ncbi:hypothetical protein Lal_00043068 [Lupinus albus]|nr:hypothetical protein Lal_00043068 [Lupinus albus]
MKRFTKNNEASTSNQNFTCFECGKPGHMKMDCPNIKKGSFKGKNEIKNGRRTYIAWEDIDTSSASEPKCEEISKEEIEQRTQQGFAETVKNRDILFVGYLKLEDCLLHYFLSYVILPKFSNHSQISDIELQLIPLPYAIFITKVLENFGVSLDGETKVALNLRESKIVVEVVHKMGFSIDPIDRRTYRHRTDRPTAPIAQPEPTIPKPPEFQAQSSSSSAMPSNHMTMDELVSLRGYITTRMDALDTQNQQIHYELHRLSSRLNSLDAGEDSFEPES